MTSDGATFPTIDTLRAMNATELLSLGRKLSTHKAPVSGGRPIRIALTGGGNLSYLGLALAPFFISAGFDPRLYVSPYGGFHREVYDDASPLVQSAPDVVLVVEYWRDTAVFQPDLNAPASETAESIERIVAGRIANLSRLQERTGALVFLSEIVTPDRRADGFFALNRPAGLTRFLREINRLTAERKPGAIRVIDLDEAAAAFGKKGWFDDAAWFLSKQPLALSALPAAAWALSAPILNAFGVVRKCLVLDLDQTLWGGVVGDDGLFGIRLEPNDAVGEAYLDFQRTILKYYQRGVLLAVCSKNNDATAREVFEKHPYCLLKLDHFAAFYANWDPKAENLKRIAADLNIGMDAIVFFDDHPVERELVRRALPEVSVVDVPDDPAEYSVALDQARLFDWVTLTKEDLVRNETFAADRKRAALKSSANDYQAYLRDLEMRAGFGPAVGPARERFIQLFNKTNQFNLRTERIQPEDYDRFSSDPGTSLLAVRLKDRFSDYGIISALIVRMGDETDGAPVFDGKTLSIDGWVMSCRVFNRGLEAFILARLRKIALAAGIRYITALFRPTAKNDYLKRVLPALGFETTGELDGMTRYAYDCQREEEPETTIEDEDEKERHPGFTGLEEG